MVLSILLSKGLQRTGFVLWLLSNGFVKGFYQKVCREGVLLMLLSNVFVKGFYSKGLQRRGVC
jgi:hypothetical protein